MNTRKISPAGLDFIKRHEGLRLKAYQDSADVWTIGYGHTGGVRPGQVITKEDAEALLLADVSRFEMAVFNKITVPLNQGQFDALVSFAFNLGEGWLNRASFVNALNRGNYDVVPAGLMRFIYADNKPLAGLATRRREEGAMWRGIDVNSTAGRSNGTVVAKPTKPMRKSREGVGGGLIVIGGAIQTGKEVVNTIQEGKGLADQALALSGNPWVLLGLATVVIGVAIYMWRKQRLEETGL